MVTDQSCLRVNEEQVAAKVMDGEVVLINLSNGYYYSMRGSGGFMWSLIAQGQSVGAVSDTVAEQFGITPDQASSDVYRLVNELVDEGLVSTNESTPATSIEVKWEGEAYESPVLEKFSDMAEMFALDPPLPGLAGTYADDAPQRSQKG